jgi:RNA-directed DNA polymerase
MQAIYLQALDPAAEVLSDRRSYGFRKERSCADAMGQCFNGAQPSTRLGGDTRLAGMVGTARRQEGHS